MEEVVTEQTNGAVPPVIDGGADDKVEKRVYDRAMSDVFKLKKEREDLQKSVDGMREQLKSKETDDMKAKEQWKELAERAETEKKELADKLDRTTKAVEDREKYSALKAECYKLGILDSAINDLDMISLADVQIEATSTGRINVLNAKEVAENVKRLRPHWFGKAGAPSVNTNSPQVLTPGSVTYKQVMECEEKYKKERTPESESEYRKALIAFKSQA